MSNINTLSSATTTTMLQSSEYGTTNNIIPMSSSFVNTNNQNLNQNYINHNTHQHQNIQNYHLQIQQQQQQQNHTNNILNNNPISVPTTPIDNSFVLSSNLSDDQIAGVADQTTQAQQSVTGIVPTLQNIVATVNLDCRLDLKTIALHARNAEYNPKVLYHILLCL